MPDSQTLRYYNQDMIGTTRFMTDLVGNPSEEAAFTAFGQRIDGSPWRFGYAGEWGYQSTLDDATPPAEVFPFLHVGARYYDPTTDRFLQRDPIGIQGGRNVYAYATNNPTISVDPTGTDELAYWQSVYDANLADYRSRIPPPPAPPKPPPLATTIITITGGDDSWLDNPRTVRIVQGCLSFPSWVAGFPWLKGVSLAAKGVIWVGNGIQIFQGISAG